jgi:tetratricopeptide (TPR) repeat protein
MRAVSAGMMAAILARSSTALATPTAEELFNEGQAAYDHRDYARAIERWHVAYQRSREPGLLYNIAQAYRLANDCPHALSTYRTFIEVDPTSDRRILANALVRELEGTCGSPHVVEDADPVEDGSRRKFAGLVLGGSGAALLVAGLVVGVHASTLGDEVTEACAARCDWATQKGEDAAGRRDAAIGYALDLVGVAAIAGGAILYYLGDRAHTVVLTPRGREGGAVITWSHTW